jgi:hypothetical protein
LFHQVIGLGGIGYGITLICGLMATNYQKFRLAFLNGGAVAAGIALFGSAPVANARVRTSLGGTRGVILGAACANWRCGVPSIFQRITRAMNNEHTAPGAPQDLVHARRHFRDSRRRAAPSAGSMSADGDRGLRIPHWTVFSTVRHWPLPLAVSIANACKASGSRAGRSARLSQQKNNSVLFTSGGFIFALWRKGPTSHR